MESKTIRERLDDYTKEKYGNDPEILPFSQEDYEIYRHTETGKWFAVFIVKERSAFGLDGDGEAEILCVKPKDRFFADFMMQENGIVQSPIGQLTVDHQNFPFKLSWTHYQVLMTIEDPTERNFYELEAIKGVWNVKTFAYGGTIYIGIDDTGNVVGVKDKSAMAGTMPEMTAESELKRGNLVSRGRNMIINTGQRTDIPAFYAEWFSNRIKEGFVCVRNPYNPNQVSRYRLDPSVVDVIGFCTKNPAPMFPYMELIKDFRQYWFVTLTPYGRDIEPNVPDKHRLIENFKILSNTVGVNSIGWRYDPILLSDKYTSEYHLHAFKQIAESLKGYTKTVVISFIDLYPKVRKNFPEAREVSQTDRLKLGREIIRIATECGMTVKPCAEGNELAEYGADCSGCMKISDYEKAIGKRLTAPKKKGARAECACYLACDIGVYNTCLHLCKYCYANAEPAVIYAQNRLHDPASPFLIGNYMEGDKIHEVPQESWIDMQESLF